MTAIVEYPDFHAAYQHYIVATAGGDGWQVAGPLLVAIQNDMALNEYPGSIEDWVNSLAVWTRDDAPAGTTEVARWTAGFLPSYVKMTGVPVYGEAIP